MGSSDRFAELADGVAVHRKDIVARSRSSAGWLKEHFGDEFVKRARSEGWRSRATFKLDELLGRDRLLKPGMVVVDLGAAPGGWSQLVRRKLGDAGRIFALDILPMQAIGGVRFIQGDFGEAAACDALVASLGGSRIDLVLSDMAPNISGIEVTDQARAMHLAEIAAEFAYKYLKPGGSLLVKVFQGHGLDAYLRDLRGGFSRVTLRKPRASRARSREMYALATGWKGAA